MSGPQGTPGPPASPDRNAQSRGKDQGPLRPDTSQDDQNQKEQDQQGTPEQQVAPEPDKPQNARAARRELVDHMPEFIAGIAPTFGGSRIQGDQHGIAGGVYHGRVHLGDIHEVHHHGSPTGHAYASGAIPPDTLHRIAGAFADGPVFAAALERLREEKVLVLSGPHSSGRRAAATMLLLRLGAPVIRALEPEISPAALRGQLDEGAGHLVCDLTTSRDRPFTRVQLLALREQLSGQHGGHLVITTGPAAQLADVEPMYWEPPSAAEALRAHLSPLIGEENAGRLMESEPARDFLDGGHRIGETGAFAKALADHHRGAVPRSALAGFGRATVEKQIRAWFDDPKLPLREKGFLLSLAVFDQAPYPLAAELADPLFVRLQKSDGPHEPPSVPVFGASPADRLRQVRAEAYEGEESTEWGPVPQTMARYENPLTAPALLTEAWVRQPSTRPALTGWVRELAMDARPLVRTRAAAATAALAHADLSSAIALLVAPWAVSNSFASRLVAANSLVLTDLLGVSAVPRILDQWCADVRSDGLRWTGIRAWALLAGLRPELGPDALTALVRRARQADCGAQERQSLADSAALLLTSGDTAAMVHELAVLLDDKEPAVQELALDAFLNACDELGTAGAEAGVLDWYVDEYAEWCAQRRADSARTAADPPVLRDVTTLWNAALGNRDRTKDALTALRQWVYEAERHPAVEAALASLLPALLSTDVGRRRIGHLLRTMPGEDGGPPPPVAERLRQAPAFRSPSGPLSNGRSPR